jgi:hypothetical protein
MASNFEPRAVTLDSVRRPLGSNQAKAVDLRGRLATHSQNHRDVSARPAADVWQVAVPLPAKGELLEDLQNSQQVILGVIHGNAALRHERLLTGQSGTLRASVGSLGKS